MRDEEVLLEALTLAAVEAAGGTAPESLSALDRWAVLETVDRWMDQALRNVAAQRRNPGAVATCALPQ